MKRHPRLPLSAALLLGAASAHGQFTLTLLHNNDGESAVLPRTEAPLGTVGGVSYFKSLVDAAKASSVNPVMLSSGDNFLAGRAFAASLAAGTFYDAEAIKAIGYDAVILGNHDFDFGPDTLAQFITQADTKYLSSNLDFSGSPSLNALLGAGQIARSTVLEVAGEKVGIVGATTPQLGIISSPGPVQVLDVVASVQAEIDALDAAGVKHIVFVSHLQSIREDLAVIPQLSKVDVAIAGGGDELLAGDSTPLLPGDSIVGPYPVQSRDFTPGGDGVIPLVNADGDVVPVITTAGSYDYLGKLEVTFDAAGKVTAANGQPIRVAAADGITPDAGLDAAVVAPVQAFSAALDAQIIGSVAPGITLDGRRNTVRTREANMGNLIADSLLWWGREKAAEFGVAPPQIAIQNGGGIRNDIVIRDGRVSVGDTFDIAPFNNFVAVAEDVPVTTLKAILENAVSRVEFVDGRFAQVAGMQFRYDPDAPAGSRIVEVYVDGVGAVVLDRAVLDPSLTFDIASIDFLFNEGDAYDWDQDGLLAGSDPDKIPFTRLGGTYQQSLAAFIEDGLGGVISGAAYQNFGEGRITVVPETSTVVGAAGLAALVAVTLARRARK
jgi:5'-nucleotidase